MFSLQKIGRVLSIFQHFNSSSITRQEIIRTVIRKEFQSPLLQPTRYYAKGKDRGTKDKIKKPIKIDMNQEQLNSIVDTSKIKMQMEKKLAIMKDEFVRNLSLRSSTGAIETLKVNADGKEYELQEIGQIIRKNPKTIVINLLGFPQLIPEVLKTINTSGMNLNPQQDGTTLYIPVPKITKEHRENLSKNAKALFIKCRDGVKDIQNNHIRKIKAQKDISIDLNRQIQNQIIAIADEFITDAEKLLHTKQNELFASKD
ncbi:CLUMA_CG012650, isoform A [Clunio marinus]|uniref:Ribosome-recycling factor, mitochondrial n=1 Tax=Clunio marinus TaxID=568069 RepID=A0A1J1IGT5_9DIPT|nr:CLUMA_CG012650, isoform A [Clunio marinus]